MNNNNIWFPKINLLVYVVVACSFLYSSHALAATPISRIDVVPYQRIEFGSTFNFGVVAFHKDGIDRVEFEIIGQGYSGGVKIAAEMTYNPRTDVWEYWVPINADEFSSSGPINVEVSVYGKDGGIRNKETGGGGIGIDPVVLFVDPEGILPKPEVWVDSDVGSDSNGVDAVGDIQKPFATIGRAIETVRQWMNMNGYGNQVGGGIVRLKPGNHVSSNGGIYSEIEADEWVTITNDPSLGGNRENTVLRSGAVAAAKKLHAKGLTLEDTGAGNVLEMSSSGREKTNIWIDDCVLVGSAAGGRWNTNSFPISGGFAGMFYTDDHVYDTYRGSVEGVDIIRNYTIERTGSDFFQNVPFVVNVNASDLWPACPINHPGRTDPSQIDGDCEHGDAWQHWGGNSINKNDDNVIVYNFIATNLYYQGLFIRGDITSSPTPADGMAFVNLHFDDHDFARGGNVWNGWYRWVDHLIWWHISSPDMRFAIYHDDYAGYGDDVAPAINDWSVKGNLFEAVQTNVAGQIHYSGWSHNHIINIPAEVFGNDLTTGSPGLDGDGRLLSDSILKDRINSVVEADIENNARGTISDVGAYENSKEITLVCGDGSCNGTEDCATCPADCGTCPRTYDFSDFISLQQAWLTPGSEDTDVNSDNIVNARDLGIMMSGWGE